MKDQVLLSDTTNSAWSQWGPGHRISAEAIQVFAELTNNHQWIHTDGERCARESPYGALIAHGLLLVSLIPGLLPSDDAAPNPSAIRIIRGIERLRLPSAVYPGEIVRARTRLLEKEAAQSGKGVIVKRYVEVWRDGGERPAVSCILLMQYFCSSTKPASV